MDLTEFESHFGNFDCIISGEGCIDSSSFSGKVIGRISQIALKNNIPLFIFSGVNKMKVNELESLGVINSYSLQDLNLNEEDSITNASIHLEKLAYIFSKSYM
jgi:glycerate kinase